MNWRRLARVGLGAVALAIAGGPLVYDRLFPPATAFADDLDHFKYGSVGVEAAAGVPYEIWRALPRACAGRSDAREAYSEFGLIWEPGRMTPVGMPLETAIVPRVGVNCALCHVGQVAGPGGATLTLAGAPNTRFDLQRYLGFLFACARGPNFTADRIIAANAVEGGDLGPVQRELYRRLIIPQTRAALLRQHRDLSFMAAQTGWGPGRAAGFQPAKVQVLHQPFDGTLDVVDIPALWAMASRDGQALHWDGANTSLHEVVLSSGIGNGASAGSLNRPYLDRNESWVRTLRSARYPFAIDRELAMQGRAVFAQSCAQCHAPGGARTGQVIPARMLGTDRNRLDSMTPETVDGFNSSTDYAWRYSHFRKTRGYVAVPLDGVWARAPYLHNGSVRTLAQLLLPPERRAARFRRGTLHYDTVEVGFADAGPGVLDTALPGNAAVGHTWGSALDPGQRSALIEYLKTL